MFVYPSFGDLDLALFRLAGPGLGNLLFPFARALVLSDKLGLQLINPTWPSLKPGPWLRNEKDKRLYSNLFNPVGITGIRKLTLLVTLQKIMENDPGIGNGSHKKLLITSGLTDYFDPIKEQHELVKNQLWNLTRNSITGFVNKNKASYIGLHLRFGDYALKNRNNIDWCKKIILTLRDILDMEEKVLIFSDGRDDEMNELLELPGISHAPACNALSDLWLLSRCKILIASDSTFSGWASYLGRMPVIYPHRYFNSPYYRENETDLVISNPDQLFDYSESFKTVNVI